MRFYTVRDLRTTPKDLWDNLAKDGEVVITRNGKPTAIMLDVSEDNFNETLALLHQVKATRAVNSMRQKFKTRNAMTENEINDEIKSAREELKRKKNK